MTQIKNIYINEAKKIQIVGLVLETSLTNKTLQLAFCKSVTFHMIVYDNLEGLITQGYCCIIHLVSGSKKHYPEVNSLFYKQEHIKQKKKFFGKI